MDYQRELAVAIDAARAAETVIRRYYGESIGVDYKSDDSPVTQADVEAEQAIREVIGSAFPDHGFYGEELGRASDDAEFVWLIDPIDGTKSFVRGYPFFSTQIALMRNHQLVVGVSNAPEFGELASAALGQGAMLNGEPIAVSDVDQFNRATLSLGNVQTLAADPRWAALGALIPKMHRTRGYGDFYHYHLLAAGKIDVVVESDVNVLDIAALTVIIREAGGLITGLDGADIGLETTTVLASNGRLQSVVAEALG